MELASRITVQRLLKKNGIRPRKTLGQNFLTSHVPAKILCDAAQIGENDTVVEIGAGLGAVTQEAARRAKKVIAIERDEKLCGALRDLFKNASNVEIVCEDALRLLGDRGQGLGDTKRNTQNLYPKPYALTPTYKVLGNIPYKITGPLVRALVDAEIPPENIAFMVQKEVGERLCAQPPRMSMLALATQHAAAASYIYMVPRNNFFPTPRVDSAIVAIHPKAHDRVRDQALFKIAKSAFGMPRKQLAGTLTRTLTHSRKKTENVLSYCGITPTQRPQELTVSQWQCLASQIS